MPWKKREKTCKNCGKVYQTNYPKSMFCCHPCANSYNNRDKVFTDETKKKISESLKAHYKQNPNKIRRGEEAALAVAKATRGKYNKNPQSLADVSHRTMSKVLRRMKLPCSYCGWDKALGDLHHINGRKIEDPHNHNNLTYLCPSCHRMVHEGKIDKNILIDFKEFIGDRWKVYYYG